MSEEIRAFGMSLSTLKRVVEALDMLEWEKKVTLMPDSQLKEDAIHFKQELRKWEEDINTKR